MQCRQPKSRRGRRTYDPGKPMHPTKPVILDGKTVRVDKKLAAAIVELNHIGLRTEQCCQGDGGVRPYIMFDMLNCSVRRDVKNGVIYLDWEPEYRREGPVGPLQERGFK